MEEGKIVHPACSENMSLVKIGTGVVFPNIRGIDKVAVELVRRVIERVAVGVSDTQGERAAGLAKRELQGVIIGVGDRLHALDASQAEVLAAKWIGIVSASDR